MRSYTVFVIAVMLGVVTPPVLADTVLHSGDQVDVTVFNHPELSQTVIVDASGNIALPVAGSVKALNNDSQALALLIKARLAPYVRNAAVEVRLRTQTRSVFVAGGQSGVLSYVPGMTLNNAAAYLHLQSPDVQPQVAGSAPESPTRAGVTNPDLLNGPIDFHHVGIIRNGATLGSFDLIALLDAGEPGPSLEPNDTIQLANKPIAVRVTGDVPHPGVAFLDVTEPLSQALSQVGGPAPSSGNDHLELTRQGDVTYVSLGSPVFSQPAHNGDRVVVPHAVHVDVLGNVVRPGDTVLRGSNTLVSAIYYAGGPSQFANLRSVQVIRSGDKRQYDLRTLQKGDRGANPELMDGDIVFIPQGSTFQWSSVWEAVGALGFFGTHL
jgi:protein involved in polysaccharide export with SLBB domain